MNLTITPALQANVSSASRCSVKNHPQRYAINNSPSFGIGGSSGEIRKVFLGALALVPILFLGTGTHANYLNHSAAEKCKIIETDPNLSKTCLTSCRQKLPAIWQVTSSWAQNINSNCAQSIKAHNIGNLKPKDVSKIVKLMVE